MNEVVKLSDIQIRVLGSMIEKSVTTPDQYPLTLNSTKIACNQKSNRDPVVNYDENEVRRALFELESMHIIKQRSLSDCRVAKYEHFTTKAFDITVKEQSILSVLMLRGPQTLGEIRTRTQRYYDFVDLDEVERVINRLITKQPYPFVVHLEKQPGQKESRYAQILDGKSLDDLQLISKNISQDASSNRSSASEEMKFELAELKKEIGELKQRITNLESI